MTVSSDSSVFGPFLGTSFQFIFDYDGPIDSEDELVVTKLDAITLVASTLLLTTDYTVQGVGDANGGTITLLVALPVDDLLVIRRVVDITQQTDIRNQGAFFAEIHEAAFDKLTKIAQQLKESQNRTLKVGPSEVGSETAYELPPALTRAGKFLAFDEDGNPVVAAGTSADLTPVSAFINTLLDDANAATARATLGVPATAEAINPNIIDAKGDILAGTAADTIARRAVGNDGDILTPNVGQTTGLQWLQQPFSVAMLNCKLVYSVAGNALTVAIKGLDGADPSATNPVYIVFRDATLASSGYAVRKVVAALSLVVSVGSTLGTVNAMPFKVWICAIDNAGTVELAAFQSLSSALNIAALREVGVITTVAEGGAGGADSSGVFYSASVRANVAMRVLGFGEWPTGLAAVGDWASAPTTQQIYGPGIPLPGDKIGESYVASGAVATTTTTCPFDDTIPQNTEGGQFMTLAHIRQRASSLLKVSTNQVLSCTVAKEVTLALFQDAVADALAAVMNTITAANPQVVPLSYRARAGAAGTTTFNTRAGPDSAATLTFNGFTGARKLGGVMASVLQIEEVAT